MFGFPRSADLMIMLVLGGAGRLYGGLVGAAVFMIAHHYLSDLNPVYWQFWLGLLLVVVVLFARGGILGALDARVRGAVGGEDDGHDAARLRDVGPVEEFGAFKANSDVTLAFPHGARHALIGPNGAGKTTLINLLTGVLAPTRGRRVPRRRADHRAAAAQRVKRGMTRTFQINTLFAGLTVLESVVLAICERKGRAGVWHRTVAPAARGGRRGAGAARDRCGSPPRPNALTRDLPYGKQRLVEIALALATRPRILLLDEPAAGIPAGRERRAVRGDRRAAAGRHDPVHRARHGPRVPLRRAHHGAGRRQGADRGTRRPRSPPTRACARSISARRSMAELLALEGVTAGYGDGVVLEDVSLALDEGDSLALLGRNGMGKTTLLVTLMGLTRAARRHAALARRAISRALPTHRRAGAGLGWVPQERYMFPSLTVEEHLTAVARPGPLDRTRASTRSFRGSRSGGRTSATSSPAASSRCSRSRAR